MPRSPRPLSRPRARRRLGGLLGLGLSVAVAGSALAAAPFPDRLELPTAFQPEGITSHGTTLYAGSLANGAIWAVDLKTGDRAELVPGETGRVAVGIDYDEANDRIWVAGGPTGSIRVYDASTGDLLGEWSVAAGFLNDVVVTEDAAYVTDSAIQQLIVIPLGEGGALPGPDGAISLPLTGDIVYDPQAFNANGITAARGWLLIVQSNTGLIFRVDPETGVTNRLEGDYDATMGDGIEIRGNTIWVVRNFAAEIAVLRVNGQLTSAQQVGTITEADTDEDLDVPTTVTIAAGSLYAVNARFGTAPAGQPYWITRLPVKPAG